MSLSLEVKKFVNSESIGKFVTILLPGELPADSAEIRAMNRERAAAQKAAQAALALEEDERFAKADADEAKKALEDARKALEAQNKEFEAQKKENDKLKSEHGKKKDSLDKAKKALDELNAKEAKLAAALSAAKEAFSASEKAEAEAQSVLSALKKAAEEAQAPAGEKSEAPAEEKSENGKSESEKAEEKLDTKEDAKPESVPEAPQAEEAEANEKKSEAKPEAKEEAKPESVPEAPQAEKAEINEEKSEESSEEKTEIKPEAESADETPASDEKQKPSPTLPEAEKALADARAALEKAKTELASAEKAHKAAEDAAKNKLSEHEKLAGELEHLSPLFEAANESFELARSDRSAVNEQVRALEKSNSEAASKLAEAKKAHEAAVKEAERLKNSVRTLKTEHESASMHYLESGKGETLLLIHTAGQSLFTFRSVFYKLAMNYHVIAVDLMGHGCSDRPDYFDYSTASHAESLISFMDALGIERAHLMGFSMGAGYVLEVAKRCPERVISIVALSPGGITGGMPLPVRMMESALFGGIASRLFRVKTVEKLLGECLFDHTVIGPHEVNEYYKPASDGESRRAIRLTVSSFGEKELMASLGEIKTPVMVISSDKDRWHSLEQGEAYANALPRGEFTVMRNAGHLLHEEKPDRTVELVRAFIPAGYGDYDGREFS
ncbi:MAG: alpha/beta fold hydrolase [Clostridia bacterium]|nr:alpha/beta fold hydrolase [Clostridia bacterium]